MTDTPQPKATIEPRRMYQWWCHLCRKWVGEPHDTQYDLSHAAITQHLAEHE